MAFEATGVASFLGLLAAAIGGFTAPALFPGSSGFAVRKLGMTRSHAGPNRFASGYACLDLVLCIRPLPHAGRQDDRLVAAGERNRTFLKIVAAARPSDDNRLASLTTSILQGGRNPLGRSAVCSLTRTASGQSRNRQSRSARNSCVDSRVRTFPIKAPSRRLSASRRAA